MGALGADKAIAVAGRKTQLVGCCGGWLAERTREWGLCAGERNYGKKREGLEVKAGRR